MFESSVFCTDWPFASIGFACQFTSEAARSVVGRVGLPRFFALWRKSEPLRMLVAAEAGIARRGAQNDDYASELLVGTLSRLLSSRRCQRQCGRARGTSLRTATG